MQMTEKTRSEIVLALPFLGLEEVNKIARECGCSNDTVYLQWRKIRGVASGRIDMQHPVVMAIAELAVQRKKEKKEADKRANKIMKQLSAA